MHRILPARQNWPLHGVARSRDIESAALADPAKRQPPQALMRRAGVAVARLALALAPHARHVWVAAGPGNNGGDGFEAARWLHLHGQRVDLSFLGDPARLPADAGAAWQRAREAGVPIVRADDGAAPALGPQDLAIDALLGLGGRRALAGPMAALVDRLNALPCPVLAVDLPSGLDGDGGQASGPHAVRAAHTLSLLTLKPGLFTGAGRDLAGTVWFDDLGIDRHDLPDAWLNGGPDGLAPHRRHAQHKGSFGDLLVVGGAPGMAGAAWLAARAAHAAGAGRVWVAPLDPAAATLDPQRPELMWRHRLADVPAASWATLTVVCGCGGGEAVEAVLPQVLGSAGRLVLDADALNAVARRADLQAALAGRAARGQATVLTPHPLEAARLLGTDTAAVQADRLEAARQLAARFACTVVLKGSGSVVAAPGEVARINTTGSAALATPGTGDVLAGWLGGRWSAAAQAPGAASAPGLAFHTSCGAVWEHGAAADASGRAVVRAADLVDDLATRPARV